MKRFNRIFIWLFLVVLILFRYFFSRTVYDNGDIVRITATVYSDPVVYGNYQTFSAAGIKVYLPAFPEISYGDRVVLEGTVNDKKLENAKLISLKPFAGFGSKIRKRLIDFYQNSLPQPMSGLMSGIILGSKNSLTSNFWNRVRDTGVAHVVVASGTNITFVVSFIFGLLTIWLPRRKAIPFVLLSIILYLYISGFDAPLVRAAIMSLFTFWSQVSGRITTGWRNLLLTAGLMLVIEPLWITDIGFLLSFVSTASIMLFNKKIESWLHRVPAFFRQDLSTTLSAQIGVAPIIFVTFGQFNILSPLINVLVLWTVPLIMVFGTVGGVLGLVFPFIGKLILYVVYPLLWWFVRMVDLFGMIKLA